MQGLRQGVRLARRRAGFLRQPWFQPQRCKPCRDARKNSTRGERQMFDATCASCGKACKVPFQPREDRPVYCSECFAKMKENG